MYRTHFLPNKYTLCLVQQLARPLPNFGSLGRPFLPLNLSHSKSYSYTDSCSSLTRYTLFLLSLILFFFALRLPLRALVCVAPSHDSHRTNWIVGTYVCSLKPECSPTDRRRCSVLTDHTSSFRCVTFHASALKLQRARSN